MHSFIMRKLTLILTLVCALFILLSACGSEAGPRPPVDEWVIYRRTSYQRRHSAPTYRITIRGGGQIRFIAATEAEFELAFIGETVAQWRERKQERLDNIE